MTVTITLPHNLEAQLKQKAQTQKLSLEEMVLDILGKALTKESNLSAPENVVARIQALPPNKQNLRPASGSLADALRQAPNDAGFDLELWKAEWAEVEAEMRRITRENTLAESLL